MLLWASYGPHQVEVGKGEVSRVGSTCLLRSKHTSREEAAPACDGMSLRVPSNFNTPRAYHRLDPTPSYPRSDTQGSLMGALNTPRESGIPPPSPSVSTTSRLPPSPAAPTNVRRPPAAPNAPTKKDILKTLSRCLHSHRHALLVWSISQWRLSLSHVLRHQALTRLQAQSQAQQQSLAALRRSLPSAAPPRPGHPTGGGGTATPAQQQAAQQGSSLLRDALLARLVKNSKQLCLCSALGRWRFAAFAISTDATAVAASVNGKGHGPGGISATAPRALKRASAQEAAIASLREKVAAMEAELGEKTRVLALTTKKLAAADSRRRVAEHGGKQAQETLAGMQQSVGRQHAKDEELASYREAEVEWAGEARRLMAERAVLAAELHVEEKAAVHARDLVVSCHAALLRQQAEQKRAAEALNASWRKGLARSAAQQSAMASDLRALGNLLARCSAQRKAENAARRRAAANLGGSPTRSTAAQTNDASVAGQVGGGTSGALPSAVKRRATPTRTLGFVTPGGASAQHRQSRAAGSGGAGLGLHAGFHAAVNEAERAAERAAAETGMAGDDAAGISPVAEGEEGEEGEVEVEGEQGDAEDKAASAGVDRVFAEAEGEAEAQGLAMTDLGKEGLKAMSRTAPSVMAATPATIAGVATRVTPRMAIPDEPPLTFTAACERAASLGEALTATVTDARLAALRRVLRTAVDRRLQLGWRQWEASHAVCTWNEAPYVAAIDARDSAIAEVGRLRSMLVDTRTQLAGARESLGKAKTASLHNQTVKDLSLKVQMLTRKLTAEQHKSAELTKQRDAASRDLSTSRYSAALAAAPRVAPPRPRSLAEPQPQPSSPPRATPRTQPQVAQTAYEHTSQSSSSPPPPEQQQHSSPLPPPASTQPSSSQLRHPQPSMTTRAAHWPMEAGKADESGGDDEYGGIPASPRLTSSSALAGASDSSPGEGLAAKAASVRCSHSAPTARGDASSLSLGGGGETVDVWSDGTPRLRPKVPMSATTAAATPAPPAVASSPPLVSSIAAAETTRASAGVGQPSAPARSAVSGRAATNARILAARAKAAAILAGDGNEPLDEYPE